jgi:hypothetical protein
VLSTWELPVGEIVSSGTDRIIVYEGSEEKLKQLGTGLLEKLGIGGSSWEQEERERYRSSSAVPAENQLPAGQPTAVEQRRIQPATSRVFRPEQELDYVELEERREREPLRQRRYLDEPELEREPRPSLEREPRPSLERDLEPRSYRDEERYPPRRDQGYPSREPDFDSSPPRRERYPAPRDERYADPADDDRYGEPSQERYSEPAQERYSEAPEERFPTAPQERSPDPSKARYREPSEEAYDAPRQALAPRRSRPDQGAPASDPFSATGAGESGGADRGSGSGGPAAAPRPVDVEAEPLDDPW